MSFPLSIYRPICRLLFHCHHQLDSLEEERANLASQCEELRLSLQQLQQQQREKAQEESTRQQKITDSSAQTDPEEVGETSASGTDSISDRSRLDHFPFTLYELSLSDKVRNPTEQQCKSDFSSVCLFPLVWLSSGTTSGAFSSTTCLLWTWTK